DLDHIDRERALIRDETAVDDAGRYLLSRDGIVRQSRHLPHRCRRAAASGGRDQREERRSPKITHMPKPVGNLTSRLLWRMVARRALHATRRWRNSARALSLSGCSCLATFR